MKSLDWIMWRSEFFKQGLFDDDVIVNPLPPKGFPTDE